MIYTKEKEIQIKEKLNKEYEKLINIYDKNNILGIFTYKDINYGLYETENDFFCVAIYIPTFNDLCTKAPFKEQFSKDTLLIDVRELHDESINESSIGLEILYSQYSIINDKYKNIYNNFFLYNRNRFAEMNLRKRFDSVIYRINKIIDSRNNDYECYRLFYSIYSFLELKLPPEDCYIIKNKEVIDFIFSLKHKNIALTGKNINNIYNKLSNIDKTLNSKIDTEAHKIIKKGIIQIISMSLSEDDIQDIKKDLYDSLTTKEKKCLKLILRIMDGKMEDIISVSKIEDESEFSKTSIRNLFKKMELSGAAEITSRGRKGTEIKLKISLDK